MKHHHSLTSLSALIAVILLGFTLLAATAGAEPRPPTASVKETQHDFGKVMEDQALTYTFVIANEGDQPLIIEDVDPDCACTVPRYDRTIPPGGKGEITLTIKPFSVLRKFKKETKVRLNDPARPLLILTLTGEGQPFIEIQPSHIVRLRGTPGADVRGEVRFISHLQGPWKITDVKTNIPDKIEVNLKTEEPDRVYVLEVRNKRAEAGPYAGLIELATTSKERPRLIVRVFGEIYYPSASGQ